MYRAVALAALNRGVPLTDQAKLAALAGGLAISFSDGRVLLDGNDISTEIRTERITTATRPVADAPPVREAMKQLQRRMAEQLNVVTEGRDQGSVVFPGAALKIFLEASPEERAHRRHRQQAAQDGPAATVDEILQAQTRRDEGDRTRSVGAMRAAEDAIVLDTDGLSLEQVVERILTLAQSRGLTTTPQPSPSETP